jgi:chromosome segregation ATPase
MQLLAESASAAPLIGGWVIGAMAILQLVTLGMQLLRWNQAAKREVHPQPLEVKGAQEYLPRQLFEEHAEQNRREHEHLFAKLGGLDRGLRAELKQDADGLQEKINTVGREVSEHSATLELQNQRLAQIDAKLDRLIERRPQ